MYYYDDEHRKSYNIWLEKRAKYGKLDGYHASLLYLLTATEPTRVNLERMYDYRAGEIEPESINDGFQTGTSIRLTRLAFNLFNGYINKENPVDYSPYYLLDGTVRDLAMQAIEIRYTPYFDPYLRVPAL